MQLNYQIILSSKPATVSLNDYINFETFWHFKFFLGIATNSFWSPINSEKHRTVSITISKSTKQWKTAINNTYLPFSDCKIDRGNYYTEAVLVQLQQVRHTRSVSFERHGNVDIERFQPKFNWLKNTQLLSTFRILCQVFNFNNSQKLYGLCLLYCTNTFQHGWMQQIMN